MTDKTNMKINVTEVMGMYSNNYIYYFLLFFKIVTFDRNNKSY